MRKVVLSAFLLLLAPALHAQCAGTTTCSVASPYGPTQWQAALNSINTGGTITSAYSCASSPPCSSGNHIDTFSLCPASSCKLTNSGFDTDDAAYMAGGAGGANYITINLSGVPSGFQFEEFGEISPALCNGTPCTTSVDNSGNGSTATGGSGGCAPCTGPAFTLTATDGVIEIIDTNATVTNPSASYPLDFVGNVFAFDLTSGTGISFGTTSYFSLTGVAFKSSGGSYSPPSKPFSNLALGPPTSFLTSPSTCSPTCSSIALPITVNTSGALIIVFAQPTPGSTQTTLASITDNKGNTYTVPTGASTCQQTGGTIDLSCGYSVITTTGVTTLTPVMNANTTAYFMYYLISASSGTITLDAQNSSHSSSSSATVTGQTLSLSGTVDACFSEMGWAGTGTSPIETAGYLYIGPQGANFFGGFSQNNANGGSMISLNQRNGNPPKMLLSGAATSQESSGICFHN